MEANSQNACSGNGTSESAESPEASFEEKRKQHYKVDLRAMKAALEEEDDEEDDDDEAGINEDLELVGEPQRQVSAQSADDLRNGCWAVGFGPEALHGGPKVGKGMALSVGGSSLQQADCVENSARSTAVVQAEAPSNVGLTVPPVEGESATRTPKKTGGKVLTWDEETIAEHDLERGTRQKIEEPNTPWLGSPSTSGRESAIHSCTPQAGEQDRVVIVEEEVEERLNAWYKVERHRASIQEQWGELAEKCPCVKVDTEGLSAEEKKEREFAEKRKQHYKVDLKAMRAALQDEDEDDEDDEDEEEEET